MNSNHDACPASASLHELSTRGVTMIPGEEPGTAIRMQVESCSRGGCVHLEQMAYSRTLGWYRQKRFTVPRSMLPAMARLLRMGDCLLPAMPESTCDADEQARAHERAHDEPLPFVAHAAMPADDPSARERSG